MIKLFPLVLALSLSAACVHPDTSQLSTQGKIAYSADQIALRVNELQNAAIAANAATPPGLDTATTRKVVTFTVSADKILGASTSGWQTALITAWVAAKADIGTVTNPVVQALLNSVDAAITSLTAAH